MNITCCCRESRETCYYFFLNADQYNTTQPYHCSFSVYEVVCSTVVAIFLYKGTFTGEMNTVVG